MDPAIFLGVGGNLPSPRFGPPIAVCRAAVAALSSAGIVVCRQSKWYRSTPVPASAQPIYVNGVVAVTTVLSPASLMSTLHAIEAEFGRIRTAVNAARVVDLDLLAYGTLVTEPTAAVVVPHPRLHQRRFVLKPLAELAPAWRHPRLGIDVGELLARLPPGDTVEPIDA
jgi:2-amino-4-hydroxy-6-hydroxymethyldihydropteridine diphosphokinase